MVTLSKRLGIRSPALWSVQHVALFVVLTSTAWSQEANLDRLLGRQNGVATDTPVGATQCAQCHPDIARQWARSSHHKSSFNNPYYATVAQIFMEERSQHEFVFCARCHDPALLVRDPELTTPIVSDSREAQAGITCLVCHSMADHPKAGGNGDYTLDLTPVPLGAEHGARVRPPHLSDARICTTCHEVALQGTITQSHWAHGQDDGDAWYDSGYNGHGTHTPWPAQPMGCQGCHMPRVPASAAERAARNGMVTSHDFLGANSALAYLDKEEARLTHIGRFLKDAVRISILQSVNGVVDILLFNQRVGHRFPGGVNDSNQVWLEVVVHDAAGTLIGQHGTDLDSGQDAHLVRAQPVNAFGEPIRLRDVQNQRGVVYDTSIPTRGVQLVRYTVPSNTHRVTARLKNRQFSPEYAEFACSSMRPSPRKTRCLNPPEHLISEGEVVFARDGISAQSDPVTDLRHAWALMNGTAQDIQLGLAMIAQAHESSREEAVALMLKALGESRLGRTDDVENTLAKLAQQGPLPNFALRVLAESRGRAFRHLKALESAEMLLVRVPKDRTALGLVARFRYLAGDHVRALEAADALLDIDPYAGPAWLIKSLSLDALGQSSTEARERWAKYRKRPGQTLDLRRAFRSLSDGAERLDAIPHYMIKAP